MTARATHTRTHAQFTVHIEVEKKGEEGEEENERPLLAEIV